MAWDPAADIDWASLRAADIAPEARAAGAEWWSLRAWMEHGAVPYGCVRLREAVSAHLPFEIKQHIANFVMEELRHHEASFRIAQALGGYQPTPRADYFRRIIPKFHDETVEQAMPFYAGTVAYSQDTTIGEKPRAAQFAVTFQDQLKGVSDIVEVLINGHSLGVRAWPPHQWIGETAWLRQGKNRITLRITNTLSRLLTGRRFRAKGHKMVSVRV